MPFLRNIRAAFAARPFLYGIAALAVLGGCYYYLYGNNGTSYETLTIVPSNFVEQISVSGTVDAAQNVDLGFSESGRIAGVYAKVGDAVAAGKVLANIENGDLAANLQNEEAKLQSLLQGTRPEQIAVTEAQIAGDQSALAQSNQTLLNAIRSAYTASDDAVHNKMDAFFNNPRSNPQLLFSVSDAQLKSVVESERFYIENTLGTWSADVNALSVAGDLAQAESEAQANLAQVTALLVDVNVALNKAIPTQIATQTDINGWITDISTARTAVNTALTTLTSAITAQKSAADVLQKDQKNLALEQAGATASDIAAQQAAVAAARAQLQKTLVLAPFSGTITKMDAKVGEIVSPSTSEIRMISNGTFQIVSYIPEVNIAAVNVGDMATATLDAYGPDTPFAAKVIAIDPADTPQGGVSAYKTTLQFLAQDPRIRQGLTANVVIATAEHPNAIVVPQGAVITRNNQRFVEVLSGDTPVRVPVTLGNTSTLGQAEVLSGLSAGDVVVLNPSP